MIQTHNILQNDGLGKIYCEVCLLWEGGLSNSPYKCQVEHSDEAVYMLHIQAVLDWLYNWDIHPLNMPITQIHAVVKGFFFFFFLHGHPM